MNTKAVIGSILIVLLLGGGWFYLATPKSLSNDPSLKEFVLKLEGRRLVSGPSVLSVREGDTVIVKITSDEAEELHLHGYDESVGLVPNTETSITFLANASGRFPFELEVSKTEVGSLEVQP